jgi:two-component sensor histidine kinase
MVEESLTSPERPIRFTVEGQVGIVPAAVVTPLSVVCNELLQNVVDHAFPASRPVGENGFVGHVQLRLEMAGDQLVMRVLDDGVGLPEGFAVETAQGLGTSIVHTLVTTEMAGTIVMRNRIDGPGTEVVVSVPVDSGRAE